MLDSIRNGFRIIDTHISTVPVEQWNHTSALQNREKVENALINQIMKGHYILASKKPTIVSTLAAIPKDNGSVRLIHDGSKPVHRAMNDYSKADPVKFQTLQDACKLEEKNKFKKIVLR